MLRTAAGEAGGRDWLTLQAITGYSHVQRHDELNEQGKVSTPAPDQLAHRPEVEVNPIEVRSDIRTSEVSRARQNRHGDSMKCQDNRIDSALVLSGVATGAQTTFACFQRSMGRKSSHVPT